jgi:uncharacterized membrane protein
MIGDFIYKYYVGPIIHGEAYTLVDTLTYAGVLIVAVYLVYRWLRRRDIRIDDAFAIALIPYIVLGGLLRVVEDTGAIPNPYHVLFVTPVIFFVIFLYAIIALVLSQFLAGRGVIANTAKGFSGAGVLACLASTLLLIGFAYSPEGNGISFTVLITILAMAGVSSLGVYALLRYIFHWEYVENLLYRLLIFGHMLDASATSYGIDLHELSYVEQHVVGSALIEATGTAFSMYPLKLVVVIPAIYILELYRKEGSDELWHLILLAMIMVGMAPGIRDLVRMVLYV